MNHSPTWSIANLCTLAFIMPLIFFLSACGGDGGKPEDNTLQQSAIDLDCDAFRQTGWCWQQPIPHGLATRDVFFLDNSNGWLVGDLGLVMHTEDGGATWEKQSIPSNLSSGNLVAVKFIDTQRGWIAGATDGALWKTENGGLNWVAAHQAPVRYITAMWVVRENVVVLTGHSAQEPTPDISAVSEDGGQTWRTAALIVNQVEEDGTLWGWRGATRSKDLGATVETSNEPGWPEGSFSSVTDVGFGPDGFAWAQLHLWQAETESWKYFISQRARKNMPWVTQPLLAPVSETAYQMVSVILDSEGSGLALVWPDPLPSGSINAVQKYARTTDGGSHWEWISVPPGKEGLADISHQFIDAKTISISYGPDLNSSFLSTDAGLTWHTIFGQPIDTNDYALDLKRELPGQLIATLQYGNSGWLQSSDEGETWRELPSPKVKDEDIVGIWLAHEGEGFAVTNLGTVFDTEDYGQRWTVRGERISNYVRDVHMSADGRGWMVDVGRGQLLHTIDGGKSWTETFVSSLAGGYLEQVLFADETHLRVEAKVCSEFSCHTVLHSSDDGGLTWRQGEGVLRYVDGYQVRDVGFATEDIAVRVDGNNAERSTDGGQTWTPVSMDEARGSANRIRFQDAQHGWMIGNDGGAWRTSDGGLTWIAGNLPLPNMRNNPSVRPWLRDVAFADQKHGWIVGDDGVVLATNDGGTNWTLQPSATPNPLYAIATLDSRAAWVAGAKTSILATVTGGQPR